MNRAAGSRAGRQGDRRIAVGAGLGVAAGVLVGVLPSLLFTVLYSGATGSLPLGASLFQTTGLLLITGALLFLLSFSFYRWGFSRWRHQDRRFDGPVALCLVGSVGAIAVVAAGIAVYSSPAAIESCLHGRPSGWSSCLFGLSPYAALATSVGIIGGALGGIGLVAGFALVAQKVRSPALAAGAAVYALLWVLGAASLIGSHLPPGALRPLLLLLPAVALLAPILVLAGASRALIPADRA
ncbi:MAG: hypothetical protein AAFA34_02365 [Thermoplasmata archaeon]|jgi:hypothetical protein